MVSDWTRNQLRHESRTPFSGELPRALPSSLEVLDLGDSEENSDKFTGGIPAGWGASPSSFALSSGRAKEGADLKVLKMGFCGLDGACLFSSSLR